MSLFYGQAYTAASGQVYILPPRVRVGRKDVTVNIRGRKISFPMKKFRYSDDAVQAALDYLRMKVGEGYVPLLKYRQRKTDTAIEGHPGFYVSHNKNKGEYGIIFPYPDVNRDKNTYKYFYLGTEETKDARFDDVLSMSVDFYNNRIRDFVKEFLRRIPEEIT